MTAPGRQWAWFLGLVLGLATHHGAASQQIAAPVAVTLAVSQETYDARKPSKARLRCVIRNLSKEPLDVPLGYDGAAVQLHSGLMTLRPARTLEADPKSGSRVTVTPHRLPPGQEVTVFEFLLDDILRKGAEDTGAWYWDWPRRSAPPPSPLHRREGIVAQLMFQAEIRVGERGFLSEFAMMKVKPVKPAPSNGQP